MKKIFTLFAAVMVTLSMSATTVYCKMTQSWWTKDGAAVGVYYWGSATSSTTWPGIRMTSISEGIWSYDVPSDVEGLIFVRVNGSGDIADWGAKTKNLTLPTDGKNLFTITSSTEVWGDPGCEGEWSVYDGDSGGQGGGQGGQGGQGGESESGEGYNFAFIGSIGGDWNVTEIKDEYTFDERGRWTGSLAAHPQKPGAAYVVIADHIGNQYKTKGWQGEDAQKVTLYWANGFEDSNVWQLPTEQTLYIIMRSCTFKGEIEVERVDKATYDAYTIDWGAQGVEETTVGEKARKVFVNGQLHIIRGDKVFDATGREIK